MFKINSKVWKGLGENSRTSKSSLRDDGRNPPPSSSTRYHSSARPPWL